MFQLLYRDALKRFLLEDLGVEGDVTSKHLGLTDAVEAKATIGARQAGVVAGLCFVETLCKLLDERCRVENRVEEGAEFEAGAELLTLKGPAPAVLAAERTALNLLSRTFGIATQVRSLVRKLEGTGCGLLPTRKTLPGLRFFDKYACETGGAARHRYSFCGRAGGWRAGGGHFFELLGSVIFLHVVIFSFWRHPPDLFGSLLHFW